MDKQTHYLVYQITDKRNGMIYIGAHATDNMNDGYMGSGLALKKEMQQYGTKHFTKMVLYDFDTPEEMFAKERELVDQTFVDRNDTYNQALGGAECWYRTKNLVSVKDAHGKTHRVHVSDPRYLSGELQPIAKGMATVKDKEGNKFQVSVNDPRYLSGELVGISKDLVIVRDVNGHAFTVTKTDPAYLSGELIALNTGTVTVKDANGNTLRVSTDDSRYTSGELVPLWQGKTHSAETIVKMKAAQAGVRTGALHAQYGSVWLYHPEKQLNAKVKKEDAEQMYTDGWLRGRKMGYGKL